MESLFSALTDGGEPGDRSEPPSSVHLMNLPAVFAGAEAVAFGGTQSDAARWHEWFSSALPAHIATSLEWPVSRWRLQALLALRARDERTARQNFERALEWTAIADYPVERAITQVQLAELLRHRTSGPEQTWRELRREGSEALRGMGLDTAPVAYAVAQVAPLQGKAGLASQLTPRETAVLAHLAEGLSYRETGEALGVKWTTVRIF